MGKTDTEMKWGVFKNLRGHFSEINDICWSRDEKYIVTASVDNHSILFNVEKACQIQRFDAHKNYVSGITIDPFFSYIVSQSTDKTVKVYKNVDSDKSVKFYLKNNIYKRKCLLDSEDHTVDLSKEEEDELLENAVLRDEKGLKLFTHRMFLDDSEVFCFRRKLDFSPDGSFLIVPCGIYQNTENKDDAGYVSYGFVRNNLAEPAFVLPSSDSCPLGVRYNPLLFKRTEEDKPFIDLPYIVVFAIATQNELMIYTTRSLFPYAIISAIHYAELTDLTWNADKLLVSSRDGYVTQVLFEEGELGVPLKKDELPDQFSKAFSYLDFYESKGNDSKMEDAHISTVPAPEAIVPIFKSILYKNN